MAKHASDPARDEIVITVTEAESVSRPKSKAPDAGERIDDAPDNATLDGSEADGGNAAHSGVSGERPAKAGSDASAPFGAEDAFSSIDGSASRRTRKVLICVIVAIVVVIVAVAAALVVMSMRGAEEASEQAQTQGSTAEEVAIGQAGVSDAATQMREAGEVPSLASLLGLTADEAVAQVGHGATMTNDVEVDEEGNPIVRIVTVELSDEPADTKTGTPSVYVSFDEDGTCIEAAFSAGLSQIGYAPMSFADAVGAGNVVSEVLSAAGAVVADGAISLPADAAAYTTYAADGTTIQRESYAFTGTSDANGVAVSWTAELTYDYSGASSSGDVSSAVRRITVTIVPSAE